jgi:hypothetical protein
MVRLVGSTMHNTTKDTVFWSETVAVSGSVTQGNGHAVLTTGTGANSSALYQTVRIARYIAGSANLLRAVVRLPDLGSDGNLNVRRWGAFTTTDGFFFQLSGSTFQVGTRIASADTLVANGSFNGECGVTCPMLNTSVHTWEIEYTNSAAWFLVDGRLLHKVAGSSAPNCATMSLPAAVQNVNSAGGVANVSLQVRTCSILRLGEQRTDPRYFHAEALTGSLLKVGAGQLHRLVINSKGASSNQVVLYDGLSAASPTIANIDSTGGAATLDYQVPFQTGLFFVSRSGSTSADVTVVYD